MSATENSSPVLKACMHEIKSVLKKYDVMGAVSLANGLGQGEFLITIEEPTWSMVRLIKSGKGYHVKIYKKSESEKAEMTVNSIWSLAETLGLNLNNLSNLKDVIKSNVEVEESDPSFTPSND